MKLFFLNGPRAGTNMELTPPGVSVGREEDNDIQLLVTGVSRYHAKITFNGSAWSILDLGSTNGTRLNGKQISVETALADGDTIVIGDQTLIFAEQLAAPKPEASAPAPAPAPGWHRADPAKRSFPKTKRKRRKRRVPLRHRRNSNFSIRSSSLRSH